MDFISRCLSSVFIVDGYSQINFLVFRDVEATPGPNGQSKIPLINRVSRIIGDIRRIGYMVEYDRRSLAYWVFTSGALKSLPPELFEAARLASDLSKGIFHGAIDARDLTTQAKLGSSFVNVVLHPLPLAQSDDVDMSDTVQSPKISMPHSKTLSVALIHLFMSACHSKLSIGLFQKFKYLPCASGTFFKRSSGSLSIPSDGEQTFEVADRLTIAMQLLLTGGLLFRYRIHQELFRPSLLYVSNLSPILSSSNPQDLIKISPSGKIARVLDLEDITRSFKTLKIDPKSVMMTAVSNHRNRQWWRSLALRWISSYGLASEVDDNDWLGLILSAPQRKTATTRTPFIAAEWPSRLCLNFSSNKGHDGGSESLANADVDREDILDFVFDWMDGRSRRQETFDIAQRNKRLDREHRTDNMDVEFEYDFNSSLGATGVLPSSLQGAVGQYPTPPSGVQSQVAQNDYRSVDQSAVSNTGLQSMISADDQMETSIDMEDLDPLMNDDLFGDAELERLINEQPDGFSGIEGPDLNEKPEPALSSFDATPSEWQEAGMRELEAEALHGIPGSAYTPSGISAFHQRQGSVTMSETWPFEPQDDSEPNPPEPTPQKPPSKVVRFKEDEEPIFKPVTVEETPRRHPKLSLVTMQDDKYFVTGKYGQMSAQMQSPVNSPTTGDILRTPVGAVGPPLKLSRSATEPILRRSSLSGIASASKRGWDSDTDSNSDSESDSGKGAGTPQSRLKQGPVDAALSAYATKRFKLEDGYGRNDVSVEALDASQIDLGADAQEIPDGFEHMAATLLHHFFSPATILQESDPELERRSSFLETIRNFCARITDPESLVTVAELVAKQYLSPTPRTQSPLAHETSGHQGASFQSELYEVASLIGQAEGRTFLNFVDLPGVPEDRPTSSRISSRPASRPGSAGSGSIAGKAIFDVASLPLCVCRDGVRYALSMPAMQFWSTLGLGPLPGPRDFVACSVFPRSLSHASIERFLNHMGTVYHECGFGNQVRIPGIGLPELLRSVADDFLTGDIGPWNRYEAACSELDAEGRTIGKACDKSTPIVLVLIDPECSPRVYQALATCFLSFRKAFIASSSAPNVSVRLQIVSSDVVSSIFKISVQDTGYTQRLARFIYEQLPPNFSKIQGQDWTAAGPSIQLEERPPRSFAFRLTPHAPADLLKENSRFHVAYSRSTDDQWITVCWTDDSGKRQYNASYSTFGRQFSEILIEIWQVTLGLLQPSNNDWRVLIVKTDPMDLGEKLAWIELFKNRGAANVRTAIFSANIRPPLALNPSAVEDMFISSPSVNTPTPKATYATPNSTPQTGFGSPANTPAASTTEGISSVIVAADADPSARLMSVTDMSWCVVLSHPMNAASSSLAFNVAICSGYLVKRTSAFETDPPVLLELNLLYSKDETGHSDLSPRQGEVLLREVLIVYRQLALLARVRGLEDQDKSTTPWHIAVAKKSAEGLSKGMLWP